MEETRDEERLDEAALPATPSMTSPAPPVMVELSYDPRVNLAMQLNGVPMVKQIRVRNMASETLSNLTVTVFTLPAITGALELPVPQVRPGETFNLEGLDLPLSNELLVAQEERESGHVHVVVRAGRRVMFAENFPLEVLAFNEWAGPASLPDLLAAFVLPGDAAVPRVLGTARELLKGRTGDDRLEGYRHKDAERIRAVVNAIHDGLMVLDLTMLTLPAGTDRAPQRVRTPSRVVETRLGTALDLSLFAAACLEKIGLNPVVIVLSDHALCGVWLQDTASQDVSSDERPRLQSRISAGSLCVFDPGALTARPQRSFSQACAEAEARLTRARGFEFVLDVRTARRVGLDPLPLRATGEGEAPMTRPVLGRGTPLKLFDVLSRRSAETDPITVSLGSGSRLDRWRLRLLDLSLDSRLISYRDTRCTIPLAAPDMATLFDGLATGASFEIVPRPDLMDMTGPREREEIRRRGGDDPVTVLLTKELVARRVHANLPDEELSARLLTTYRAARMTMEESATNGLFLALGFLGWYETPHSDVERRAPLLLVPVEITRPSLGNVFHLRLLEEEPRINVALLERLHDDFGLDLDRFERLPEEESGIDVTRVIDEFRRASLPFERWTVTEDARIGLFEFQRHVMWLDLDRLAKSPLKGPVAHHLVEREERSYDPEGEFPEEGELDDAYAPAEAFCPLDADAAQLAAVIAAGSGRSFVLQGAPGTGKSQTIANMVAHAVAEGRRVLVVSEKREALDAVERRLGQVGLGEFCLALHSNRTRKRSVLDRFQSALQATGVPGEALFKETAGELRHLRRRLDDLSDALHEQRFIGHSAYTGIARLISLRDEPSMTLILGAGDTIAPPRFRDLHDRVEVLRAESDAVGGVVGHGLLAVQLEEWEPAVVDRGRRAAESLVQASAKLRAAVAPVASAMMLPSGDRSLTELILMDAWRELVQSYPGAPRSLITAPDWPATAARLRNAVQRGRARDVLRGRLLERYHEDVLRLPHAKLVASLERSAAIRPPMRWFAGLAARRRVARVRRSRDMSGVDKLIEDLRLAERVALESEALADRDGECARLFGAAWRRGEADWGQLDRMVAWTTRLRDLAAAAAGEDTSLEAALLEFWVGRLARGGDAAPDADFERQLTAFEVALTEVVSTREQITLLLELDEDQAFGAPHDKGVIDRLERTGRDVLRMAGELRNWTGYARARREAREVGLGPVVRALESGEVPSERLVGAFERSSYEWWIGAVFAADPRLGEFSSARHERLVDRFRDLDRELISLTSQLVRARQVGQIQNAIDPGDREHAVLARELEKRTRQKPIRRLLSEIPRLSGSLMPVFLMSPAAVAQYLGPRFPMFDLVIFDEASQIPVWDGIGALARARQAVIVGDPRQLPPTPVFLREDQEDVFAEDELEELESLLSACKDAQLTTLTLKTHYRSRHESLFAFSNHHYYENRLTTFPSPETESSRFGVRLHLVPGGLYDRGRTRTNPREAEALVAEVVRRLWDPFEAQRSLGVVTFNRAQRNLIEDLLEQKRREHPEIEPYFDEAAEEYVFVKSLDCVQGDERDVVLFSVGYGPDESGRVSMNFGPLNRSGGERRLNVAISRARQQLVVFASMRAESIELARTRASGVRHLRTFLDYAERGVSAMAEAGVRAAREDWHTPFERDVQFALEERGYVVTSQVGCSPHRVDLAVAHPADPDRLVLGIVCDGAVYRSAHTARDRDRLRPHILEDLGWKLIRVWSIDWWFEPEHELERIITALDAAVRETRVRTLPQLGRGESEDALVHDSLHSVAPDDLSTGLTTPMRLNEVTAVGGVYEPLRVDKASGTTEDLHNPQYARVVREQIHQVIDAEGPITVELLMRRVAEFWGTTRLTRRTVARLRQLLEASGAIIRQEHAQLVCWRPDQEPRAYRAFRRPGVERAVDHIPIAEIANCIEYLLGAHIQLDRTTLARETSRMFGIARAGPGMRHAVDLGVGMLVRTGRANEEAEMVRMPDRVPI